MNWAIVFGLSALIACTSASAQSAAYRNALKYYKDQTSVVIRNGRELIRPAMSSEERDLEDRVDLRIPLSGETNAYALREGGDPVVVINAGFIQVLEWIATVYVFESDQSYSGCTISYTGYLVEGIEDNSRRIAEGIALRPVLAPYLYGQRYPGACHGLPKTFSRQRDGDLFAKYMEASIVFIYLHELAHHRLGHVARNPGSKVQSRRNESEADAWAFQTAANANYQLAAAMPILFFLGVTGGASLEDEKRSTHPLGFRRYADILKETRQIYVQKSYPNLKELDEMIQAFERVLPAKAD